MGIAFGSAPPPGRSYPDEERSPRASGAALAAIAARVTRLVAAMERTAPARPWGRSGTSPCDPRAALPAAAGVLAMPAACTRAEAEDQTRAAFRAVLLALTKDLGALLARLKPLVQDAPGYASSWNVLVGSLRQPTVAHVEWMVDALHAAHVQSEHAARAPDDDAAWQQAGRHYEAALLGAQVLAVWVSWLDFAKPLSTSPLLSAELILERLWGTWAEMEPVLAQLRSGERAHLHAAARTLRHQLPAWSQALYAWGQEAERDIREGEQVLQALLIVQAAFDLATMREVIRPLIGRAGAFAFVLPGIGGITAGGAATGVRVVISAEWVRAMEHLIAIGAIGTVDIAHIAGVSSLASVPVPRPVPPAITPDGSGAAGAGGTPTKETPKAASAEGTRVPSDNAGAWVGKRGDGIFTPKGTDWKIPFRNGRPDFSTFVETGHEFRNVRGLTGKGDRSIMLQAVVARFGQKYGFTTHSGAQRWLSRYKTKYGTGLEMHHSGSGRIQLVPSAVHKAANHGGFKGSASQLRK